MHQIRRPPAEREARAAVRGPRLMRWAAQPARATRSLQVLRVLQDEILSGAWLPGSQIPVEAELSERLAVSRSTVREAVSTLVHLGMLEPRPSQGTFVRARSAIPAALAEFTVGYDPAEIRSVASTLEADSCAAAAIRRAESDVDELRALARRGCEGERAAVPEFHELLTRLAGNALLADLRAGLEARLRLAGIVPDCAAEHGAMADAVAAGDAEAARAAARRHADLRLRPAGG